MSNVNIYVIIWNVTYCKNKYATNCIYIYIYVRGEIYLKASDLRFILGPLLFVSLCGHHWLGRGNTLHTSSTHAKHWRHTANKSLKVIAISLKTDCNVIAKWLQSHCKVNKKLLPSHCKLLQNYRTVTAKSLQGHRKITAKSLQDHCKSL